MKKVARRLLFARLNLLASKMEVRAPSTQLAKQHQDNSSSPVTCQAKEGKHYADQASLLLTRCVVPGLAGCQALPALKSKPAHSRAPLVPTYPLLGRLLIPLQSLPGVFCFQKCAFTTPHMGFSQAFG